MIYIYIIYINFWSEPFPPVFRRTPILSVVFLQESGQLLINKSSNEADEHVDFGLRDTSLKIIIFKLKVTQLKRNILFQTSIFRVQGVTFALNPNALAATIVQPSSHCEKNSFLSQRANVHICRINLYLYEYSTRTYFQIHIYICIDIEEP